MGVRPILIALVVATNAFVPPCAGPRRVAVPVTARNVAVLRASSSGGEAPSRVSRLLNKVSFGFLGSAAPPVRARPTFFEEAPAASVARNDGAAYTDDLEAFMDTPAPPRPARKTLGEPAIDGADGAAAEEASDGATAVKELKTPGPRDSFASADDVAKLNRLMGLKAD